MGGMEVGVGVGAGISIMGGWIFRMRAIIGLGVGLRKGERRGGGDVRYCIMSDSGERVL